MLRLERDCELSEDGVLDDWLVAVDGVDADDSELGVSDDLELDEDELELGVRELSELIEDNEDGVLSDETELESELTVEAVLPVEEDELSPE